MLARRSQLPRGAKRSVALQSKGWDDNVTVELAVKWRGNVADGARLRAEWVHIKGSDFACLHDSQTITWNNARPGQYTFWIEGPSKKSSPEPTPFGVTLKIKGGNGSKLRAPAFTQQFLDLPEGQEKLIFEIEASTGSGNFSIHKIKKHDMKHSQTY